MTEKRLSLAQALILLSDGKKLTKTKNISFDNQWYIYLDLERERFVDNSGKDFLEPLNSYDWVEYKTPKVKFEDIVVGKIYLTNINSEEDCLTVPHKITIVYRDKLYVLGERYCKEFPMLLHNSNFEQYSKWEGFLFEEVKELVSCFYKPFDKVIK
jgi:hypothetical protein